jgi:trimeric autotransporter adhesin
MSGVTPLPIDMNDDLAKAVAEATDPEVIKSLVHAEFDKQVAAATAAQTQTAVDAKAAADAEAAKTAADAASAEAAKIAAAASSSLLTRTENIGGTDIEFTGASEAEIDKLVINALKVAAAVRPSDRQTTTVDAQADAEKARVDAELAASAKADLEIRFKRGDVSVSEFIEQSGAVKDYLEKQGIPIEALRASVEREQGTVYEQSWAEATKTFLKSPVGCKWPGGERNQHMLGVQIAALGLTDATDKVAAIAQAYEQMQKLDLMFPGEAEEKAAAAAKAAASDPAAKAAADAAAAAAVKAAADAKAAADKANPPKTAPTSSTLFGASSGVGAADGAGTKVNEPLIAVPKDASPQEILAAWKEAQVKAGVHPDVAFQAMFAKK